MEKTKWIEVKCMFVSDFEMVKFTFVIYNIFRMHDFYHSRLIYYLILHFSLQFSCQCEL